ncbi:hypothetical protein GZ78_06820 [Endozoicomonas numazuensis]|uniref:Uncharacterized protein n=1 Tax=Endozoicomonas numazuensis TaxID=1137799 RepID=A0A081NMD2_9GAMM|nr:hypothetical protein GZ78_06820 [Endozoicomonas numazuensis]
MIHIKILGHTLIVSYLSLCNVSKNDLSRSWLFLLDDFSADETCQQIIDHEITNLFTQRADTRNLNKILVSL